MHTYYSTFHSLQVAQCTYQGELFTGRAITTRRAVELCLEAIIKSLK